jgi:hypothetical protein
VPNINSFDEFPLLRKNDPAPAQETRHAVIPPVILPLPGNSSEITLVPEIADPFPVPLSVSVSVPVPDPKAKSKSIDEILIVMSKKQQFLFLRTFPVEALQPHHIKMMVEGSRFCLGKDRKKRLSSK